MSTPNEIRALEALGDRVRPMVEAREKLLSVPDPLGALLPWGGLQRGSLVATTGLAASSLALALAGPSTEAGSWLAAVGVRDLGLVAAAELGVDLGKVLIVEEPDARHWPSVVAALVDAVEVVLVRPTGSVPPKIQQRLLARARERGSVLMSVGGHPDRWARSPDVVIASSDTRWEGIEPGHGRLNARRVTVEVSGRGSASRVSRAQLWLPDATGRVAPVASDRAVFESPWTLREVG